MKHTPIDGSPVQTSLKDHARMLPVGKVQSEKPHDDLTLQEVTHLAITSININQEVVDPVCFEFCIDNTDDAL